MRIVGQSFSNTVAGAFLSGCLLTFAAAAQAQAPAPQATAPQAPVPQASAPTDEFVSERTFFRTSVNGKTVRLEGFIVKRADLTGPLPLALITHGKSGDTMVVMAVTDKTMGSKGISAFIVERGTPGLLAGKKEDKLGMRASETSEVILQNCLVPADQLLGKEGHGFRDTMQVLDAGRIGIAALAVGLAQGAYEASVRYARERMAFGRPIGAFQAIQWKLADMRTEIDAAHLLCLRAATRKEKGLPFSREASMAKAFASETAVKVANEAVQIHGGYGYIREFPAERHLRDARVTMIYEGTSEVQRIVIARMTFAAG